MTEPDRGASAGAGGKKPLDLTGIDWVIVGGESGGKQARPMRQEWAREIRDAVIGHKVLNAGRLPMLHLKQWGSHDADGVYRGPAPTAGGKLLDGKDWCEVPASSAGEPAPARLFA